MKILLIGSGSTTTQLNMLLSSNGHSIPASLAVLSEDALSVFPDYDAVLVVSPEATAPTDVLSRVIDNGRLVVVVASNSDGIGSWAASTGLSCFPYPMSSMDQNNLIEYLSRYASGGIDKSDMYRRVNLGGELSARVQSGMTNIRKIAISSPKGGTGKTTVAMNLAVAFALSGFTTYLVDADGNVGSFCYHIRAGQNPYSGTLFKAITDARGLPKEAPDRSPFSLVAKNGKYLKYFNSIEGLPTLKFLPGLETANLGNEALQDDEAIETAIKGLYEAGVASNGIVIMDVGINPSHPIHRAALGNADAISVVLKAELPDIAQGKTWLEGMIKNLSVKSNKKVATEFISTRVKTCYNMVFDNRLFDIIHKYLNESLMDPQRGLGFTIAANGVLPKVEEHLAWDSHSSDRVTDIFCWRYKKEHTEDLAAYTEALINFGTQFLPVLREAASHVGLVAPLQKKRSPFAVFTRV